MMCYFYIPVLFPVTPLLNIATLWVDLLGFTLSLHRTNVLLKGEKEEEEEVDSKKKKKKDKKKKKEEKETAKPKKSNKMVRTLKHWPFALQLL